MLTRIILLDFLWTQVQMDADDDAMWGLDGHGSILWRPAGDVGKHSRWLRCLGLFILSVCVYTVYTFFFFLQTHFQLVNLFKAFGLQVWWIFGS